MRNVLTDVPLSTTDGVVSSYQLVEVTNASSLLILDTGGPLELSTRAIPVFAQLPFFEREIPNRDVNETEEDITDGLLTEAKYEAQGVVGFRRYSEYRERRYRESR